MIKNDLKSTITDMSEQRAAFLAKLKQEKDTLIAEDIHVKKELEVLRSRSYKIEQEIKEIGRQEYHQKMLAHEFVGWEETKIDSLRKLTVDQLLFLWYMWSSRRGLSTPDPHAGCRDFTPVARGSAQWIKDEWREKAFFDYHVRLLVGVSCKYCHLLSHYMDKCPILLKKHCTVCGQHGHTIDSCKMSVGDMFKMQQSTVKIQKETAEMKRKDFAERKQKHIAE